MQTHNYKKQRQDGVSFQECFQAATGRDKELLGWSKREAFWTEEALKKSVYRSGW